MNNQSEEGKILYFPICPKCNEIVSIEYNKAFNFKLVCGICKSNTLLSIEEIKYKTINEMNNNIHNILNTMKDNKKIAVNKVIPILTKLNYISLTIIRTMYRRYYNKKLFSLNSYIYYNQLENYYSFKKPLDLTYDEHLELIKLLRKIYYFHFLYKSIIKIYEKTGINIFISQEHYELIWEFKIPLLLNSICISYYYNNIKYKLWHFLKSKKIYKYLENKEYYDNVISFSIFNLPILKYIVIAYKTHQQSDSYFDFYDYQKKKIFHFECNIIPENILIRGLTDGKILISEEWAFSIYLKKEKNDKFEFIQKIDVNNCDTVRIPIDGITHNFFIIEKDYRITIFEKKTNLLNPKKELYNKK